MFILGTISAGLLNKKESFLRNISLFNPGVYFIQESKARMKNKIVLKDYITFELLRKNIGGGGLLTAVHKQCNTNIKFLTKYEYEYIRKKEIHRMRI